MRALVDKAACCGYALCVEICPEVYKLGDDAVVTVQLDPVPPDLAEKVRRAVEECPQSALSVDE